MGVMPHIPELEPSVHKVVVLGHSGYIGRHLIQKIKSEGPDFEVLGHSLSTVDLTKEKQVDQLAELFDLNTVLIVCSGIKKQYGDNLDIFNTNISMISNLCRCLHKYPVHRAIYFSSAEVYGDAVHNTEITEKTQVQPSSYYGIAKFASERLMQKAIAMEERSSLLILRPPLVYGPGEKGSFYGPMGFVRAAMKGDPILLWGMETSCASSYSLTISQK